MCASSTQEYQHSNLVIKGSVVNIDKGIRPLSKHNSSSSSPDEVYSILLIDAVNTSEFDSSTLPSSPTNRIIPTNVAMSVSSNQVRLELVDDWALSTSFIAKGDLVEISKFGFHMNNCCDYSSTGGILIHVNNCTEIHVIRKKRISINSGNVGHFRVLDVTDREEQCVSNAFHNTPCSRFGDRNMFLSVDRYYDVIKGQRATINEHVFFIQTVLGIHRTSILDVGCGTGLYAFALRNYGINVVCLDASHVMQRQFEEKNRFFQESKSDSTNNHPHDPRDINATSAQQPFRKSNDSTIQFHLADVMNFALADRDDVGNIRYSNFSGVLCIDVLALLPDVRSIQSALLNISNHMTYGSLLIVSFPNAHAVVAKGSYINTREIIIDRFQMSVGAVLAPFKGTLALIECISVEERENLDQNFEDTVESVTKHTLNSDNASLALTSRHIHANSPANACTMGISTRKTTWRGTGFHPNASTANEKFISFHENFTELLIPSEQLEAMMKCFRFSVKAIYGSLTGEKFQCKLFGDDVLCCRKGKVKVRCIFYYYMLSVILPPV